MNINNRYRISVFTNKDNYWSSPTQIWLIQNTANLEIGYGCSQWVKGLPHWLQTHATQSQLPVARFSACIEFLATVRVGQNPNNQTKLSHLHFESFVRDDKQRRQKRNILCQTTSTVSFLWNVLCVNDCWMLHYASTQLQHRLKLSILNYKWRKKSTAEIFAHMCM